MVMERDTGGTLPATLNRSVKYDLLAVRELHDENIPPSTANHDNTMLNSAGRIHTHLRFPIQGRRIRLCFNGDKFAKPIAFSISAYKRFDAFLADVNSKVGRHPSLLYGVRHIFNTEGKEMKALDELDHQGTYVCASTTKYIAINYEKVHEPIWCSAQARNRHPPAQLTRPSVTRQKCTVRRRVQRRSSLPLTDTEEYDSVPNGNALPMLDGIELLSFLGKGHSADVYKGRMNDDQFRAIKVISLRERNFVGLAQREVAIMKRLNHDFIIKLHRAYETPEEHQIMELEYLPHGDLFEYMKSHRVLDEIDCATVIHCLASALSYLHELSIVHRDIKPENLLVYFEGDHDSRIVKVKLTDFGLATETSGDLFTVCGTPTYVAPEIIDKLGYAHPCDCWSMGIIMYLLLSGVPPFYVEGKDTNQQHELFDLISEARPDMSLLAGSSVSNSAQAIVRRLLSRVPNLRMTAREVMLHKWTKDPLEITDNDEQKAVQDLLRFERRLARYQPRKRCQTHSSHTEMNATVAAPNVVASADDSALPPPAKRAHSIPPVKLLVADGPSASSTRSAFIHSDGDIDSGTEDSAEEFVFYRPDGNAAVAAH